ncbi:MAG: helix-turn-helix transcriptional regulator [Clostridiales bacterium]|jgi:DNA-binding XRE family transcriptional regulator|nr:helix-turn-helix transcriptional regulator [Clostridiales bacterium]
MPEFTCKLKEYRTGAGLTQERLGEMTGVRRETIIRLEAGKYNPSLRLAIDISRAVGAPIEEIFIFQYSNSV